MTEKPIASCSRSFTNGQQFYDLKKTGQEQGSSLHKKMELLETNKTLKGTIRKRKVKLGPREEAASQVLKMANVSKTFAVELKVMWKSAGLATAIDRVAITERNGQTGYVPIEFKKISTLDQYRIHKYQFKPSFLSLLEKEKRNSIPTFITATDLHFMQNLYNGLLFQRSFPDKPIVDSLLLQVTTNATAYLFRMPEWISFLSVPLHQLISSLSSSFFFSLSSKMQSEYDQPTRVRAALLRDTMGWRMKDEAMDYNVKETSVYRHLTEIAKSIDNPFADSSLLYKDDNESFSSSSSSSSSSSTDEKDNKKKEKGWFMVSTRVQASADGSGSGEKFDLSKLNAQQLMKKGYIAMRIQAENWSGAPSNSTPSLANRQDGSSILPSSSLSVLGPSNLKFDGAQNSNFELNALAIAFGKTPGGVAVDPHESYPFTHFHLPKQYELANNSYNLQIIMDNVFREGIWHVTQLLPWREWDPASIYKVERWIFDSGLPQRASYESAQRMMTSRRTSESFGMLFWGIAQQSELGFWRTRIGQLHWALQKLQMKNAVLEAACMGAIVAINTCRQAPNDPAKRRHMPYTKAQYEQLLEEEYQQIDMLKRNQHGLDYMANKIQEVFDRRNVSHRGTLTLIMPDIINKYIVLTPERNLYFLTGIPKARPDDSDIINVKGVSRVFTSRNFLVNQTHTKPVNLHEEHVVLGQHGIFLSGRDEVGSSITAIDNFKTSDLNMLMYNLERDDIIEVSYRDAFWASCLYRDPHNRHATNTPTQLKDYELTPEIGRKYFASPGEFTHWDKAKRSERYRINHPANSIAVNVLDFYSHFGEDESFDFVSIIIAFMKRRFAVPATYGKFKDMMGSAHAYPAAEEKKDSSWKTLLGSLSLETAAYFEFCLQYHIPIFLAFKWDQPHITLKSINVNALANIGEALGNTLIGKGMYLVGTTPKTGMVSGTLTYHGNSVVTGPELVHNMRGVFVTGYVEGGTDRFWKYEDRDEFQKWKQSCRSGPRRNANDRFQFCHRRPEQSMFCQVLPLGCTERLPAYSAHSGRWSDEWVGRGDLHDTDTKFDYHTSTAPWYNAYWGTESLSFEPYTRREVYYNDMRPVEGDITHQAFQLFKTREGIHIKTNKKIRDRGWLPENIQSGMRQYIEGKKPLTSVAFHCQPQNQFIEIYSTKT